MKLPIPSILGQKEKPEYLLALLLRQEKTTAVIIEQIKRGSTIVGTHEEYFETNLEDAPEEEWLRILDRTISRAEEKLPSSVETHKTVFGVPASWVEEKHIKKDHLLKLKKTSEQLALTPIGFLEIPEAIVHLLQEEEGAPVSALITEIGKKYISVSLVRGGKLIDTKTGALDDTPAKTVDLLLRSFANVEVFPSRIIVFNGGFDEQLVQSFIAHHWSKSLPFLHVPQISILPAEFDAKAVVYGAATQIGFDILGALDISEKDIKTYPVSHTTHDKIETESTQEPITPKNAIETSTITTPVALENFGFVKDEDVALLASDEKNKDKKEDTVDKNEKEEVMPHEKPQTFAIHSPHESQPLQTQAEETKQENVMAPPSRHMRVQNTATPYASMLSGVMKMPQTLMTLLQTATNSGGRRKKLTILLPAALIILIGLFVLYTSMVKATVFIEVTPKEVDQNEDVTFALAGENDFDNNTIHASTTSISLPGKASVPATGKKETGTKGKGTVTIFNSSDTKKQLQAGATITSSNNLEYVLDKEVTIASASGDIFTGIKSGTAQVAVTAKQIGSEYNVPSNTKFSVGDNASLAAKNDQAFSGGSKKQVTVVSKDDIAKITASFPKSLTAKAREELIKKVSSDETLLTVVSDFKPSTKDFSAGEGEEAKTLTLTSSVTFEGVSYANEDLLGFTKTVIKNKFDENLTVSDRDVQNTLKNVETEGDDTLVATLVIHAKLLPKFEQEKLQAEISGKTFEEAREILARYPQVETVTISLFPPIPLLPEVLPGREDNIVLDIQTNE